MPPDFSLDCKSKLFVRSSLTLSNYPNNCLLTNLERKKNFDDIFYSIYTLENEYWSKLDSLKCRYGSILNINRHNLKIKDNKLAIVIPSKSSNLPEKTRFLPQPQTLRIDNSPVAERASYNFQLDKSTSCFQGEYPYKMTSSKYASFFSTNLINGNYLSNSSSYLLLVNIKKDASVSKNNKLKFFNPKTKEIRKMFNIKSNSFVVLPLDFLKNETYKGERIFSSCDSEIFLPIYININVIDNNHEINVEHTHPPFENFWGRDRLIANKIIKNNWVL